MPWYRKYRTSLDCGNTFGIGIVSSDGKILSNDRDVYKPVLGSGIIPNEARDHHERVKESILKRALDSSKLNLKDVDIVAYSAGPGLSPCLLVGANYAKELAEKLNKKLIPINHCIAHLEIGKFTTKCEDPIFVYLSGGNTQVIAFAENKYRIFGETQDISIGNCFDTVARKMNLPMPGGSEIEKLAKEGSYIELPYVVKGMDVSFSGIQTAALGLIEKKVSKEDLAYSLQETCFAMLVEVAERALAHTGKKEVLLVGGVAVNKRLQKMMRKMCEERGARFYVVPQEYGGDNGVMIALIGMLAYRNKWKQNFKENILPKWRTDEVSWFKT